MHFSALCNKASCGEHMGSQDMIGTFCPVHQLCGSGDSSPGLNSPVCQLGKAIPPEGHAASP